MKRNYPVVFWWRVVMVAGGVLAGAFAGVLAGEREISVPLPVIRPPAPAPVTAELREPELPRPVVPTPEAPEPTLPSPHFHYH